MRIYSLSVYSQNKLIPVLVRGIVGVKSILEISLVISLGNYEVTVTIN